MPAACLYSAISPSSVVAFCWSLCTGRYGHTEHLALRKNLPGSERVRGSESGTKCRPKPDAYCARTHLEENISPFSPGLTLASSTWPSLTAVSLIPFAAVHLKGLLQDDQVLQGPGIKQQDEYCLCPPASASYRLARS